MYNKQQYKNVRHQATRRAQKWFKKLHHLDAIQVLFVSVAIESPVVKQLLNFLEQTKAILVKKPCNLDDDNSGDLWEIMLSNRALFFSFTITVSFNCFRIFKTPNQRFSEIQ